MVSKKTSLDLDTSGQRREPGAPLGHASRPPVSDTCADPCRGTQRSFPLSRAFPRSRGRGAPFLHPVRACPVAVSQNVPWGVPARCRAASSPGLSSAGLSENPDKPATPPRGCRDRRCRGEASRWKAEGIRLSRQTPSKVFTSSRGDYPRSFPNTRPSSHRRKPAFTSQEVFSFLCFCFCVFVFFLPWVGHF